LSSGKGYYYHHNNGARVDITWGDKISETMLKNNEKKSRLFKCKKCGESFKASNDNAKWCSQECRHAYHYTDQKDPIKKKAKQLSGSLLLGVGRTEKVMDLVSSALDTQCKYCKEILTLDTVSVDHIEPYGESKQRNDTSKAGQALRRKMDRIENLQIICRSCNGSKGDFNDKEFSFLLSLDDQFPGIVRKIQRRLQRAKLSWRKQRG